MLQTDQGFGYNGLLSLWLDYPFRVVVKLLSLFGFSWFVIEKLLWIAVFAIAFYASYKLTKSLIGSLIYSSNTYILLLVAGGQLGVALAYALAPFVLFTFMERRPIVNGLWFALLVILDLRIAYLVLAAIILYLVVAKKIPYLVDAGISLLVAASVNLYWILPTVLASHGTASLGTQFTSPGMLKFLSFADFSHAISLLHPNWPDNLFGKVYFLQPEFLILPILAFGSLFFIKQKSENKVFISFFALLALIGAFFAKGVNPPFGAMFAWCFVHIPGFVMFRDPTKFYLYIAISYAVLISLILKEIKNKYVMLAFSIFWLFTIRGFKISFVQLPSEYVQFKNILVADTIPSRTLWIPSSDKFAYSSDTHPILASDQVFPNASLSAVMKSIGTPEFQKTLADAGVKYVIVPEDLGKRIFLNDYMFDPKQRLSLITSLDKTQLTKLSGLGNLAVYENKAFIFHSDRPQLVVLQQKLADIGTGISVVFLIGWIFGVAFL